MTSRVGSREEKRAAESCVEDVSGIREVINQLRVSRSDTQSSQNKGTTGSTGSSQASKTARPAERGEG